MTSIRQVAAQIIAARDTLLQATGLVSRGREALEQAGALLGGISDSSYNETMLDAVALIQQADTHAENAGGSVRDGERALARYQAVLTGTSTAMPRPASPSRVKPEGRQPVVRYDRDKAEQIRAYSDDPKTVGRLYDPHGQPVGELIVSGVRGPADNGTGLHGRWKHLASLTEHAEGHAAALIRRHGLREAVLYLNNAPCRGPAGCYNNLAAALPAGARLTIWVVNGDGSIVRVRRTGTGEALQP